MRQELYLDQIDKGFCVHPVLAILGPRQCGKTTLAHQYCQNIAPENYFDLEDPEDRKRIENPKRALEFLKDIVIIDGVQRAPELYNLSRACAKRLCNSKRRCTLKGCITFKSLFYVF